MKTDVQLQKNVMAELNYEPMLDAAAIGVGVHQGVVSLSGNVNSFPKSWQRKGQLGG